MIKIKHTITNEDGLHARPASDFCKEANNYVSDIKIIKDGKSFEGKSILMVLCVGAVKGDVIEIVADGVDEKEAIEGLKIVLETE